MTLSLEAAVLDRPHNVESDGAQRSEDENGEELMKERRVEGRDDDRVAGLQRPAHAGHALALFSGRRRYPGLVHSASRILRRVDRLAAPPACRPRSGPPRFPGVVPPCMRMAPWIGSPSPDARLPSRG